MDEKYISKINHYYWQFLERSQTGLKFIKRFVEFNEDAYKAGEGFFIPPGGFEFVIKNEIKQPNQPMAIPFDINIDVSLPLDKIRASINSQTESLMDFIRNAKKTSLSKIEDNPFITDYIRNAKGAIEKPFAMWKRCIKAYDAYAALLPTGERIIYKKLAVDLGYYKESKRAKNALDSAVDRLQEDIKTAMIFINRAEEHTFPYDDNGGWSYRHFLKQIRL